MNVLKPFQVSFKVFMVQEVENLIKIYTGRKAMRKKKKKTA